VYNGPFKDLLIEVERIPVPTEKNIEPIKKRIKELFEADNYSAFLYEPLIQGANCMQMYEAQYLDEILKICKKYKVLCIADEVMTGLGKTGKYFASDYVPTQPDMICLSKALTAGMVPMAITSCTDEIYRTFLSDKVEKAFLHAHTYTATPLSCAVAKAAIELVQSDETQSNIQMIHKKNLGFAKRIKNHESVASVRCHGVILALDLNLDLNRYGNTRDKIYSYFLEQGVYLRPLGNTIYWVPPFITTSEQMDHIYQITLKFLEEMKSLL